MTNQVKKMGALVLGLVMLLAVVLITPSVSANSIDNPVGITLGNQQNGMIKETEKENYYKFELPSAGSLRLNVEFHFREMGIRVFDSNQKQLYEQSFEWDGQTGNKSFALELDKGTYYLRFVGDYYQGDSDCFGDYSFTLTFTSAGVNHTELNNIFDRSANASLGSPVNGHIAINKKENYYKFELPSAGSLRLNVEFLFREMGIRVFDSNQKQLYEQSFEWDGQTGNKSFTLELDKGTYYLRFVGDYNQGDSLYFGGYNFTLAFISAGVGHGLLNNTYDRSADVAIGSLTKGHIAINKKENYYRITLQSKGSLRLNVEFLFKQMGIRVFDSNQRMLHEQGFEWDGQKGNKTFTLELDKGTYYLRFVGDYFQGDSYCFGTYNFKTTFSKFNKPGKVKLSSLKKSGYLSVKAKWKRMKSADGYQIIYSTKKSFKGKKAMDVSDGKAKSTIISYLKNKKTYYVKVRAYKMFKDKKNYGNYGNVRKIKARE